MKKLYVGCSLTVAPQEFRDSVDRLKDALRSEYQVFDFLGLTKGTAEEVYEWDIHHCVSDCDLFLAICDLPSLGLGYEMGVAVEKFSKPTLAVAHTDAKVARLIQGINLPHFSFVRYSNIDDIPHLLKEFEKNH